MTSTGDRTALSEAAREIAAIRSMPIDELRMRILAAARMSPRDLAAADAAERERVIDEIVADYNRTS